MELELDPMEQSLLRGALGTLSRGRDPCETVTLATGAVLLASLGLSACGSSDGSGTLAGRLVVTVSLNVCLGPGVSNCFTAPVPGAHVDVDGGGRTRKGETDEDGHLSVSGLDAGLAYSVRASWGTNRSVPVDVIVESGSSQTVDITLPQSAEVRP
jgi:hypothetical protein